MYENLVNHRNSLIKFFKKHWFSIAIVVAFVVLRVPSLVEPKWYVDEGIYSAIGNELARGEDLYSQAWDHKPPGIYWLYAFLIQLFGDSFFLFMKLTSLVLGIGTLLLVSEITKLLAKGTNQKLLQIAGLILLATYWLEGTSLNAENIFIFTSTLGFYIYLTALRGNKWQLRRIALAAFVIGFGILFKAHPAAELVALTLIHFFLWLRQQLEQRDERNGPTRAELVKIARELGLIFAVGLLPIALSALYFALKGLWEDYIFAVILFNFEYSDNSSSVIYFDSLPFRTAVWGLVMLGLGYFYAWRKQLDRGSFIALSWLVMSYWAAQISVRPYAHYLLQVVPPLLLLFGLWGKEIWGTLKVVLIMIVIYVVFAGSQLAPLGFMQPSYYLLGWQRALGLVDEQDWESEFFYDFELDREVEALLANTSAEYTFILEDKPWLYENLDLNNPTAYTVKFHVIRYNQSEVVADLEEVRTDLAVIRVKRYPFFPDLAEFAEANLVKAGETENYELYVSKD